mgnify:CR=1 FL=1
MKRASLFVTLALTLCGCVSDAQYKEVLERNKAIEERLARVEQGQKLMGKIIDAIGKANQAIADSVQRALRALSAEGSDQ